MPYHVFGDLLELAVEVSGSCGEDEFVRGHDIVIVREHDFDVQAYRGVV
jgi:hypothetical protein